MPDYVGFVEAEGHRNVVRADTVTIMRKVPPSPPPSRAHAASARLKMVDGRYNLHIIGYSYAKVTSELQVFQSLDEAYSWMVRPRCAVVGGGAG